MQLIEHDRLQRREQPRRVLVRQAAARSVPASSAGCSAVLCRCRVRFATDVSPVRVSIVISTAPFRRRARSGCAQCRPPAPSAAKYKACAAPGRGRPWRAMSSDSRSTRLGRNPASVLPAPVGAISRVSRPACAFSNSVIWCAPGLPAARREPVRNRRRQARARCSLAASPGLFRLSRLGATRFAVLRFAADLLRRHPFRPAFHCGFRHERRTILSLMASALYSDPMA